MKEASWSAFGYEIVSTGDGSPTLHWVGSATKEYMHHCGGAYSETQLIYGNPLRESLAQKSHSAISVGLGLGYNEILVAVECVSRKIEPGDFQLLSFESEELLSSRFLQWIQSAEDFGVYDSILAFFLKETDLQPQAVKRWLQKSFECGGWILKEALNPDFALTQKYGVIFYDAFSSKTSPHLWDEGFLKDFFAQACDEGGMVTTYACLGNLKRALKTTGFEIHVREGFKSKRNSTLGIRKPSGHAVQS